MSDTSRRKLLKSIAAGSGAIVAGKSLPESWSRPVVDSVVLPVHAQTSGTIFSGAAISGGAAPVALLDRDNFLAEIGDALVPKAIAGNGGNNNGYFACAMVNGTSVSVSVAGLGGEGASPTEALLIRRGTLDIGGAEGTITASGSDISDCSTPREGSLTRPAWIDDINKDELVLHILTRCGEGEGEKKCDVPVLVLVIPRSDGGCVPEPNVCAEE